VSCVVWTPSIDSAVCVTTHHRAALGAVVHAAQVVITVDNVQNQSGSHVSNVETPPR
jgi:hypothetical protein